MGINSDWLMMIIIRRTSDAMCNQFFLLFWVRVNDAFININQHKVAQNNRKLH